MKNNLLTLLLLLLTISGFSQNTTYTFERATPVVKKEKLREANSIRDVYPDFWHKAFLTYGRYEMDKQVLQDYSQRNYVYPQPESFIYPYESYSRVVDYISVVIFATANGKTVTAQSPNDQLSAEQKNILASADLGTDISINVQFRYKSPSQQLKDVTITADGIVTVVPETEAEFPGGVKHVAAYFTERVINKLPGKSDSEKLQQVIMKFTVDEEGEIVNAAITRTSTDPKIDKMLLEAINDMPRWKPAQNSNGEKVKQEFIIPFGGGGC